MNGQAQAQARRVNVLEQVLVRDEPLGSRIETRKKSDVLQQNSGGNQAARAAD
jgi:hypothetical protein